MRRTRSNVLVCERAVRLLEHGRRILLPRSGWTQHVFARDRNSVPVRLDSDRAVRFCAVGALVRAELELHGTRLREMPDTGSGTLADDFAMTVPPWLVLAGDQLGAALEFEILGRGPKRRWVSQRAAVTESESGENAAQAAEAVGATEEARAARSSLERALLENTPGHLTDEAAAAGHSEHDWGLWRLATELNDTPGVGHGRILRAYEQAIVRTKERCRRSRADAQRRKGGS